MAVIQPKKRGRPAGTRKKHAPTVESVRDEWEKKYFQSVKEYENYLSKCTQNFMEQIQAMGEKIKILEHQAVEYRAVISYLENVIERTIKK